MFGLAGVMPGHLRRPPAGYRRERPPATVLVAFNATSGAGFDQIEQCATGSDRRVGAGSTFLLPDKNLLRFDLAFDANLIRGP